MQSIRPSVSSAALRPLVAATAASLLLCLSGASFAAGPAAGPAGAARSTTRPAATDAMNDSIVTVDELVRNENAAARLKARRDAEANGLIPPDTTTRDTAAKAAAVVPPAAFVVNSISGVEGQLRTSVNYNGSTYERLTVGARVGGCVIDSIQGKLVKLKVVVKGLPASQCPTGIWTGEPPFNAAMQQGAGPRSGFVAATPTSMPSPLVNQVAAPRPYSSADPVALPGRAPLNGAQPMVQLVPAEPTVPGQTAIPLAARPIAPAQDMRRAAPGQDSN